MILKEENDMNRYVLFFAEIDKSSLASVEVF